MSNHANPPAKRWIIASLAFFLSSNAAYADDPLRTFSGHSQPVSAVAVSPNGNQVLSGSHDNSLKLWDIQSGQEIRTFNDGSGMSSSVTFSSDGKYALTSFDEAIFKKLDLNTGLEVDGFQVGPYKGIWWADAFHSFTTDRNFALLRTGGYAYSSLDLWNLSSKQAVQNIFSGGCKRGCPVLTSATLSSSGNFAVYARSSVILSQYYGFRDATLTLRDIQTGQDIRTFSTKETKLVTAETGKVPGRVYVEVISDPGDATALAISPDENFVLAGFEDGALILWDLRDGTQVHSFAGNTDWINSVMFSPDGRHAISDSGKDLKLWDVLTGHEIHTFTGHDGGILSIAFSPDGRYALTGSYDNTAKLWDLSPYISPIDTNYAVFGQIQDALGNPMADVTVEIDGRETQTDALGNWRMTGLEGDREYTVQARKDGWVFAPVTHVTGNRDYDVALALSPASDLALVVRPHVKRHLQQGEPLTYLVSVLNGGDSAATGLTLRDTLPEGTDFTGIQAPAGAVCDHEARCTLPDLAPGEMVELAITVATDAVFKRIENRVTLVSHENPPLVVVTPKYVRPYLSVKGDTNPGTVTMNSQIRHDFVIELSEFAPSPTATEVVFEAELSDNVSLIHAGTDHGQCDVAQAPKIVCNLDDLSIASADATSKATVFVDVKLEDPALLVTAMQGRVRAQLGDQAVTHTRVTAANIELGDAKVDAIIALDITQSMDDNLTGTKLALEQLLDDLAAGAARPFIALISFRDDVELVAASRDPEVLLHALDDMRAEGGGACPEASAQAMELAIQHITPGGAIILATDAPPYADTDMDAIIEQLNAANVSLESLVGATECPSNEAWESTGDQ